MFYIKQNDTSPAYESVLMVGDEPVNLAGASVRFHMRQRNAVEADVVAQAIIADAEAGRVIYEWKPEDTAVPGFYHVEWEVTYSDDTVETFPNRRYERLRITAALA